MNSYVLLYSVASEIRCLGAIAVGLPWLKSIEVAAKAAGIGALGLLLAAYYAHRSLSYLETSKAPVPRVKAVERLLFGLQIGIFSCAIIAIVGYIIIQLWPRPIESATLLLHPDKGDGPPWFRVTYSANGSEFSAKGAGKSATITVPAGTDQIALTDFSAPAYVSQEQQQGKSPPWLIQVKDHTAGLEIVYDHTAPALPTVDELKASAGGSSEIVVSATPTEPPNGFAFVVENRSDFDVDLWFFNCRHLRAVEHANDDQERQVTLMDNSGVNAYSKWLQTKTLRPGGSAQLTTKMIGQLFEPTGWFAIVARFYPQDSPKQKQVLLGIYDLFKSNSPKLTLQRTTAQDQLTGTLTY